ncbi:MAG: hypothetical protein AB8B51_15395 [Sedimentitalea sp.]
MRQILIGAGFLTWALAGVGVAAPGALECAPNKVARGEQIVTDVYLFRPSGATATIADELTIGIHEGPVAATLQSTSNGGYEVRWQVKGIPVTAIRSAEGFFKTTSKVKTNATFRMLLAKDLKTFTLRGNAGRLGRIIASGTCRAAR